MDALWFALGAALIVAGVAGAVVPALPGIPLIFGGLWLIAAVDRYHHVGPWWLLGIAAIGALGLAMDLLAAALGARRVGASRSAVVGALLGSVVGLLFGLPGLLIGPFAGALLGEFAAGSGVLRSTEVGLRAWLGMIVGTIVKVAAAATMLTLFGAAWWWNRVA
jgi:uncharacterized protein YqgC (DUF456 family)